MTDAALTSNAATQVAMARLRMAATFFTVAVLFHNFDHLRRGGDSVGADVFWLGSAAILLEVGVVLLVFMRHPAAPLVATLVGGALAVGYLVVHFTPERSFFSDSFVSGNGSALSVLAAGLETAAAVVLCASGWLAMRTRALSPRPDADTLSIAEGLRQPAVLAMAVGNLVIFVGSLLTR
jgi:hypothetical protein